MFPVYVALLGVTATAVDALAQQPEKSHDQALMTWKQLDIAPTNYKLRLSHYDPSLGGTNCDHDCSVMASGDFVQSWVNGRNGIYAAACPREWGWQHGKKFSIAKLVFECRDTGGWINCYRPGQTDIAIKNAHSKGYMLDEPEIAQEPYCWVDMMISNSIAPYGTMTKNWGFIK